MKKLFTLLFSIIFFNNYVFADTFISIDYIEICDWDNTLNKSKNCKSSNDAIGLFQINEKGTIISLTLENTKHNFFVLDEWEEDGTPVLYLNSDEGEVVLMFLNIDKEFIHFAILEDDEVSLIINYGIKKIWEK